MESLKKNLKWIILVIVLMIIVSGVSVYATSTYLASQITYKDGKSVANALDDLYTKYESSDVIYIQPDQTANNYTFLENYKTVYICSFRGPDVPVIKVNNVEQSYIVRREHSGWYIYVYKLENINKDDILYHAGFVELFMINK